MDSDFQQRYQNAEQAYGEGRYGDAQRIASALLDQLGDPASDPDTQAAALGWRAFVALLLGHIELLGLNDAVTAAQHYQLVLESDPPQTLAELAQQGLDRAAQSSGAANQPALGISPPVRSNPPEPPDLLQDPFLSAAARPQNPPHSAARTTAMPWLEDINNETDIRPERTPPPEPVPAEPAEATALSDPDPDPMPNPEPEPEPEPEPIVDPLDVLKGSLLRVRVPAAPQQDQQPEQVAVPDAPTWRNQLLRLIRRSSGG